MVREDILYGLKNAAERGENLNEAAKSFINAGYDEKDVMDAMNQLSFPGRPLSLPAMPAAGAPAVLPELPKAEEKPKPAQAQPLLPSLPALKPAPAELPPLPPAPVTVQVPPKQPEFPKIISKPVPSKEVQELPQVGVKKKGFLQKLSDKALLISIGVVGLLIMILTIYLVSLLLG